MSCQTYWVGLCIMECMTAYWLLWHWDISVWAIVILILEIVLFSHYPHKPMTHLHFYLLSCLTHYTQQHFSWTYKAQQTYREGWLEWSISVDMSLLFSFVFSVIEAFQGHMPISICTTKTSLFFSYIFNKLKYSVWVIKTKDVKETKRSTSLYSSLSFSF